MTLQDSPHVSPAGERRRAPRARLGSLPIRLFRSEGTLVDISESGALVRLPRADTLETSREITLVVDSQEEPLLLRARVVRSSSQRLRLPTAPLARTVHDVGIEFVNLPARTATALSRLVRDARSSSAGGQSECAGT